MAEDSIPSWAMNAYDMVWATAAAFAEAVRSDTTRFVDKDGLVSVPSGESFMRALPRVSFQGLSGPVSFDANGDRSAADHQLAVTNLVWDNSTSSYTTEQVGTINIDGGRSVVNLNGEGRSPNLAWPDWTYYPEV